MTTKKGMPRREVLRIGAAGAAAAWAATRSKLGVAAGKVPIGVQLTRSGRTARGTCRAR